jgi:hypothetical protein
MMFVIAFSSIGNFGIMTRQRTQVFPFVLVLLCLPLPRIDDGDDLVDDSFRLRKPYYEPPDRSYETAGVSSNGGNGGDGGDGGGGGYADGTSTSPY